MPSVEKIQQQLDDVQTLRSLSGALLEIASIKIKGLREEFQTNQEFFNEVSDLYRLVKIAAKKQNYRVDEEPQDSGREVHVAITSNKRFHGILNRTVMDSFVESIVDGDRDFIVVGFTGKHLLEGTEDAKKCQYVTFNEDFPTPKEQEVFLKRVKPYGKVILHYPRFENIFRQKAEAVDITYTSEVDDIEVADSNLEQIYEPELPHILSFFESQIRQLLFRRIMLESELSRTAARLVKMNTTHDSAETVITEKRQVLRKELMVNEDIRLLETFSSRVQWEKT